MPNFPPRIPRHRYVDPLERIWLACAARAGFRVERDDEVYASSDGRGTITLGAAGTLDPDDSLAQLVFHELCHALVEGPESHSRPDWGLDNFTDRDEVREFAAVRLQAALAAPYGLRHFLAPTTDFRAYFEALGPDPLWPPDDPAVIAAKLGAVRAESAPWTPHLFDALAATAVVVRAVVRAAAGAGEDHAAKAIGLTSSACGGGRPAGSAAGQVGVRHSEMTGPDGVSTNLAPPPATLPDLRAPTRPMAMATGRPPPPQGGPPAGEVKTPGFSAPEAPAELPSLYGTLEPESTRHASGFWTARAGTPAANQTCGSCDWLEASGRGARCRKAGGKRIEPGMAACERWERGLDCQDCGACCREAYDSVTVSRRDPVVKAHPELIVRREGYLEVQRAGERCAALEGGRSPGEPFACRIYPDRPKCCRDLALGSVHCLWARRRVGLSR